MKFSKHEGLADLQQQMAPMIDIVFQLIIFFLIAMQIKNETADLTLPGSKFATEVKEEKEPPLIVNILRPKNQDGQPNRQPYYCMGNSFDLAGFKKFMKNRETYYFQVLKKKEMPIVRVRADIHAEYRQIQDCLIACRDVGIWQVRLTTLKGMR